LGFYVDILSEVMEDLFDDSGGLDSETHDTSRTGRYSVKIKLYKEIILLLPILGQRIENCYRAIQNFCTNCFGSYPKQAYCLQKMQWGNYVPKFNTHNPIIPGNCSVGATMAHQRELYRK
jgi:hypothetical protein